jgi:hypothetical protein
MPPPPLSPPRLRPPHLPHAAMHATPVRWDATRYRGGRLTDLERSDRAFFEVLSKIRSCKFNLTRSLFKPWFPVRLRKRPPFRATVLSQHTPIHVGSLGRVWGQVEIFRKVRRAPLATTATRTPYVIYLENRSKISKADRKRRLRRKTWSLRIRFNLIHQLVHDKRTKITTRILPRSCF